MNARLLTIFVILMTLIIAPSVGANVPGSWTQSNVSGFGDVNNFAVLSLASFDRKLYAGTGNDIR